MVGAVTWNSIMTGSNRQFIDRCRTISTSLAGTRRVSLCLMSARAADCCRTWPAPAAMKSKALTYQSTSAENVPEKAGFPIHHGTIEDIQFTRKYDVITMLHVLEHTSNPLSTLKRCKELLNEGGYIVVVVPNYQSLDSRIKDFLSAFKLKSRPYKHLALGHHNYVFSIKSLEILGEKSGLQIIHRQTQQPAWRAGRWHRFLERYGLATWCWIVYRKAT